MSKRISGAGLASLALLRGFLQSLKLLKSFEMMGRAAVSVAAVEMAAVQ